MCYILLNLENTMPRARSLTQRLHIIWVHWCEMSRTGKCTGQRVDLVAARGWEEDRSGGLTNGYRVSWGR